MIRERESIDSTSGLRKVLQESIIPRRHNDQHWWVMLLLVVLLGKEDTNARFGTLGSASLAGWLHILG